MGAIPSRVEREIAQLEARARRTAAELGALRRRFRLAPELRAELVEIRGEWEDVHAKWWVGVVALLLAVLLFSYFFYTNLGWYADQRSLPLSSDWLLDRLPVVNLLPVLSWGWLGLHAWALAMALLYTPRRLPFLLFTLSVYLCVRTLFVFLSPIGAPERMLDMGELDWIFSRVMGVYTFQNEFIFSGHTAIPFLFFLYFETPVQKAIMLGGSLVMATAVLLTHNHYSVDVLAAFFMAFAIFELSKRLFVWSIQPLFVRERGMGTVGP